MLECAVKLSAGQTEKFTARHVANQRSLIGSHRYRIILTVNTTFTNQRYTDSFVVRKGGSFLPIFDLLSIDSLAKAILVCHQTPSLLD